MGHVDCEEDAPRRKSSPSLAENQIDVFVPTKIEKAIGINYGETSIRHRDLEEGLHYCGEPGDSTLDSKVICDSAKPLGKAKKLGSACRVGTSENRQASIGRW